MAWAGNDIKKRPIHYIWWMRVVSGVLFLSSVAALAALGVFSCNGSTSTAPEGGSTTPTEDGAICACATPDCLPNCNDLPACKLECTDEGTRIWVNPCGTIQYAQVCANGCTDAGIVNAQCD